MVDKESANTAQVASALTMALQEGETQEEPFDSLNPALMAASGLY